MEQPTQHTPILPLQLEKAYTFFMVPFYYDGDWESIHQKITRWIPQQEELYKEEVLYPYIMELFKRDEGEKFPLLDSLSNPSQGADSCKKNRLKIYQLKTEDKGTESQFFFDRIIGKRNAAILAPDSEGRKNPLSITFKFCDNGNFAPHLFISPTARIGIMTFCIELERQYCTTSYLKILNYHLHKRDEINKYRCICPLPESKLVLSEKDFQKELAKYSTPEAYKELCRSKDKNRQEYVDWDVNFFVSFLLNTLGSQPKPLHYFNKARTHLFTFCSIDDTAEKAGNIGMKEVTPELLRLSRGVIDKYLLPFDQMTASGAVLETYQNIFFSTSIEGTAMMCIAKDMNKIYVSEMQEQFNRQYLLIYLLTLLQRYTLLDIDRRLTEFDAKTEKTDDELWNLIEIICKLKVNCYYTDVSIYSHHSQFYQHCCRRLHIPETFKEIDEKVGLLKLTTDRLIQKSLERQRSLQEEEARKHQEEIERIKAKEEQEEKQREEEREQRRIAQQQLADAHRCEQEAAIRRQTILSWIVAALTIAQVVQATFEIIQNRWKPSMWLAVGTGFIWLVALFLLMKKDILNFMKPNPQTKQ